MVAAGAVQSPVLFLMCSGVLGRLCRCNEGGCCEDQGQGGDDAKHEGSEMQKAPFCSISARLASRPAGRVRAPGPPRLPRRPPDVPADALADA